MTVLSSHAKGRNGKRNGLATHGGFFLVTLLIFKLFWFAEFLVSFFTIPKTSTKNYIFTEPQSEYIG